MNEYQLIQEIAARLRRGGGVDVGLFGCDAELVTIGPETWGLTIDEFTPEEDRFSMEDPARLGRNLVTATLSDLLAAGIAPRFFLSALSVPPRPGREFIDGVTSGMASVLQEAGCVHCGGDLGCADPWRFTGFAMGPLAARQPLTHRLPAGTQVLCVTGTLGDLNLATFLGTPTPAIEFRGAEAALIREHATACMDTSGGLMDALWMFHERSPTARIVVDASSVPVDASARQFAEGAGIPAEALLLGGAGEYELLFAISASALEAIRSALEALGISVIGTVEAGPGEVIWRTVGGDRRWGGPPPCPREAASLAVHAQEVIRMAREIAS